MIITDGRGDMRLRRRNDHWALLTRGWYDDYGDVGFKIIGRADWPIWLGVETVA